MRNMRFPLVAVVLAAVFATSASAAGLTTGKADLKSAGALTFGPPGILFVGDSATGTLYALDTADTKLVATPDISDINAKVAALLGTSQDQILINDLTVNPVSKRAYLSVSRGRGPDAVPVIVRTAAEGKLEILSLDNIPFAKVALPNPISAEAKNRNGASLRVDAITDIAFSNGKVVIAGLSNEEFSSNLRSVDYPFTAANRGTSVEIYHGSHGRFETQAPVRTFTLYRSKNQDYILASYTCTPLVIFRTQDLKEGTKVLGKTVAELGAGNRPLDMIVYTKGGTEYILMNNSDRGVMKVSADNLDQYQTITAQTEITGAPYETLKELKGVTHLAQVDDSHVLMLVSAEDGAQDLKAMPLP